ncbi:hypothetical protein RJ639_043371 [Escallonia herrerae]|uniref:Legume lectin domain-containing protein n=1 Tax=Escallonia herrerae TaxID=1293975 RepID=A0AA88WF00_9ASTE|nr:hypothetical protein RJ639_043371 [Escallonia herrerae]
MRTFYVYHQHFADTRIVSLFPISYFDPLTTNIFYEGDAMPSIGAIEFNVLDYLALVGQAFYAERVPLWENRSRELSDFSTYFLSQLTT